MFSPRRILLLTVININSNLRQHGSIEFNIKLFAIRIGIISVVYIFYTFIT